jgi:hypothetical protein
MLLRGAADLNGLLPRIEGLVSAIAITARGSPLPPKRAAPFVALPVL